MDRTLLGWLLPAACAVCIPAAAQQSPSPDVARRDPLDAAACVPAAGYQSAFSGYRRFGDDTALSWRDANQAVGRIGGWRAYAREANEPVAPHDTAPTSKDTRQPDAGAALPAKAAPDNRGHQH